MARYFDAAQDVLERHGGTVEKFIGDAVMAVFGVPTVHEDDALRAVRAAAELRDALASLNAELERDYGVSLLLRTGVNTRRGRRRHRGATRDRRRRQRRRTPRAGRRARRDPARRADTRLWSAARSRSSRSSRCRSRGRPSDVPALPPAARRRGRARVRPAARLAVRRPARRARAAARGVRRGRRERRCRLVTVLGPPGIGKSRLARELEAARRGEAAVLSGRCLPYGDGITYWPLVEIFRDAARRGRARDGARRRRAGGDLLVGAEDRSSSARGSGRSRSSSTTSTGRSRRCSTCSTTSSTGRATRRSCSSAWRAPSCSTSVRPGAGRSRPRRSRSSRCREAESDELIDELVDDAGRFGEEIRARIRETAEGNPLFVEQLLAAVAERGETEELPPTIHALLAARLDGLPVDERDVLERASVVGLEFEWDALAVLSADGSRPPGALLSTLVRKELIVPHEAIGDDFRFRHVLIRDAAYERIPKELRAELHERFADWLERRAGRSSRRSSATTSSRRTARWRRWGRSAREAELSRGEQQSIWQPPGCGRMDAAMLGRL